MDPQKLTIRQMCDMFDVTPRTLRFYEAKELISPERDGQKRLYSKAEIARVKLILRGKKFGFSLEDIRQLLELYNLPDQQQTQLERTYTLAREKLAHLRRQRQEMDLAIEELEQQLEWGRKMLSTRTQRPAAE